MQLGKLNTIGLIVGICGGIAGLGAAILAEASTGNFPWGSVSIALLFIVIFGGVFWFIFRPMLQAQAVLKSGQPAEATVLKLSDTGVTLNENPEVKLLLEVRPPGQAPSRPKRRPSSPGSRPRWCSPARWCRCGTTHTIRRRWR